MSVNFRSFKTLVLITYTFPPENTLSLFLKDRSPFLLSKRVIRFLFAPLFIPLPFYCTQNVLMYIQSGVEVPNVSVPMHCRLACKGKGLLREQDNTFFGGVEGAFAVFLSLNFKGCERMALVTGKNRCTLCVA